MEDLRTSVLFIFLYIFLFILIFMLVMHGLIIHEIVQLSIDVVASS